MTWRKLSVLVPQLPAESATATALRLYAAEGGTEGQQQAPADPETEQWSRMEQILAAVRDELHILRWLYSSTHSQRGKGPKWKPEPLPRPGVAPKKKRLVLAPEQTSVLAQYLARTQGDEVTYN